MRDGLEMLLRLEKDMEVVGVAEDGDDAVAVAGRLMPDLV